MIIELLKAGDMKTTNTMKAKTIYGSSYAACINNHSSSYPIYRENSAIKNTTAEYIKNKNTEIKIQPNTKK